MIYESIQDSLISKEIQSLSNENNVNFNEMEVIGEFELPQTMNLHNKKILDKNINENEILLCRLCAQKTESMIYIFQYSTNQQNIAEKINNCLPITVSILYIIIFQFISNEKKKNFRSQKLINFQKQFVIFASKNWNLLTISTKLYQKLRLILKNQQIVLKHRSMRKMKIILKKKIIHQQKTKHK